MFGKLGKKSKATAKMGNMDSESLSSSAVELVTYITIPDVDGEPSARLEKKVTIGREVGSLLIEESAISPRHCTFYINQDVVSVMDHSSETGTFINKKKIAPGKMFILGNKDKVKIGDFSVLVHEVEEPIEQTITPELEQNTSSQIQDIPEVTSEMKLNSTSEMKLDSTAELSIETDSEDLLTEDLVDDASLSVEEDEEEDEIDVEEVELDESLLSDEVHEKHNPSSKPSKKKEVKAATRSKVAKKSSKTVSKVTREASAGMITRIVASLFDLALCFIILEIFLVYVDFAMIYNDIPSWVYSFIQPLYMEFLDSHYIQLTQLVPQVGKLVNDLLEFEHLKKISHFISFFFVIRVVFGVLFSRSFGQALVGIHFDGRFLTKRLVYPLRELIGFLLFPFTIFDLPSLISKRTFKEVITFTQYLKPTKTRVIFSTLIFTPLLALIYCFSPIVKGLSVAHFVPVSDESGKVREYEYKNKVKSSVLGLYFDSRDKLTTLPSFSIKIKNKKRILNSGILFVDLKDGKSLQIKKVSEFKMLDVYSDFVKLNPFSKYFQPKVFNLVNDVALKNKNFKFELKERKQIISETKQIISSSFGFDFLSIDQFIMKNGVLFSGFRDFREKIENLYIHKIKEISFVNFGDIPVAMGAHKTGKGNKNSYSFFTLGQLDSIMFSSNSNLTSRSNAKMIRSFQTVKNDDEEVLEDNASSFVKYITTDNSVLDRKLNQNIYSTYYSTAQSLLRDSRFVALEMVMKNIKVLLDVLDEKGKLKNKKLYQNLTELLEAIKSQDYRFFDIKKSKTV
jgi:hypothetical protein